MDAEARPSLVQAALAANKSAGGGGGGAGRTGEVHCPICRGNFVDAFVAPCGHSFCHTCIATHLSTRANCPECGAFVATDKLTPNYALTQLSKALGDREEGEMLDPAARLRRALSEEARLDLQEVRQLVGALMVHEERLKQEATEAKLSVLLDFLHLTREEKLSEAQQLRRELDFLSADIQVVQEQRRRFDALRKMQRERDSPGAAAIFGGSAMAAHGSGAGADHDGSAVGMGTGVSLSAAKQRIAGAVDDLEQVYTSARSEGLGSVEPQAVEGAPDQQHSGKSGLGTFMDTLATFTRFTRLRESAVLRPPAAPRGSTNIISSIEFDCMGEYFATAGVSKCISVYSFSDLINSSSGTTEPSMPSLESSTRSKLSCLCWSHFQRNQLASSDYEGVVTLWDIDAATPVMEYDEHEKRVWSVDCASDDAKLMLSGSDDCRCKLWSTQQQGSVMTLELKANVCCVRFNPHNSNHVALGSADHHVHYYDLRHTRYPLQAFSGHTKAVSYVRFMSETELASASTDNTLKLWDVRQNCLTKTLRGHVNEKNFIGLSTGPNFLACGSETNELFVYHKRCSRPAMKQLFTSPGEIGYDNAKQLFISAVCWRGTDPTQILAANSMGVIKAFSMV